MVEFLRTFDSFYDEHRPHRTLGQAAPLRALPVPITGPDQITNFDIHGRGPLSGVLRDLSGAPIRYVRVTSRPAAPDNWWSVADVRATSTRRTSH